MYTACSLFGFSLDAAAKYAFFVLQLTLVFLMWVAGANYDDDFEGNESVAAGDEQRLAHPVVAETSNANLNQYSDFGRER